MAGKYSKSTIDRLGERLRSPGPLAEDDLRLLQAVRAEYEAPLAEVERVLRRLGLEWTSRPKTVETLIEKLRRERVRLSQVQDIAGIRIVRNLSLTEQDALVATIGAPFQGARILDRRSTPSFGYRAVHLVVKVLGFPVEIQVRTMLQDAWAQTMERLADAYGRELRYGADPDPGLQVGSRPLTEIFEALMAYSGEIASVEEMRKQLLEVAQDLGSTPPRHQTTSQRASWRRVHRSSLQLREQLSTVEDTILSSLSELLEPTS